MVKKIISIIIVLALVFGAGYYTCLQLIPDKSQENLGPVYSTKEVTRGDLKVGIDITGQLDANYGATIFAPSLDNNTETLEFTVDEILVSENDSVKKGDLVAKLSCLTIPKLLEQYHKDISKKYDSIADSQKIIDEKTEDLGIKVNKNITSYTEVNPSEGIVISSPIAGRITALNVKEGERIKEATIATIVNDSEFKIPFMLTPNEYPYYTNGQKVKLKYGEYEGYYDGVITELNTNPVNTTFVDYVPDGNGGLKEINIQAYVHNGIIVAKNPGLIPVGTKVSIYSSENANPAKYSGKIESYLDQSNAYTTETIDTTKAILATEVYVSANEFVEKGQAIAKIAGNDVTKSIQADMDRIKEEYDKIKTVKEEAEEIEKKVAELNEFSSKLNIVSNTDGIISWSRYSVGDTFTTSASSSKWDLEVFNVYNSNQMSIYTQVTDLDVNYIQLGATVDVTVDALPGQTFEGTVERMYQNNDNGKISYRVEISVTGGDGLKPGMNSNCFIDAGESLDTLLIPIEAVFEEDDKQKVEVLGDDGNVTAVEIEIGLMNDRYVEVLSGLEEGQKVVTGSTQDLMPSQSVDKSNSLLPGKTN